MDYKNDNRTPRDRITGEFLSELLFTESGGECDCRQYPQNSENRAAERTMGTVKGRNTASCNNTGYRVCRNNCTSRNTDYTNVRSGANVEITGDYSLAMAYVPMQQFGELFDLEEGFCEGTIFKSLRFPFYPTSCRKGAD